MIRRGARVAAALGLAGGVLMLSAGPVAAAEGNMSDVQVTGRSVQFLFDAGDIPAPVDGKSVKVTVDGTLLRDANAVPFKAGDLAAPTRSAMLVMDTSGSMNQNGRLVGAKQAALAFLNAAPADLSVGLVTFADRARLIKPPTLDHAAVASAVSSVTATGSTAIYDAVVLAVNELGSVGSRSIVLLTDGKPEGGQKTATDATTALRSAKVRLDAVAFQTAEGRAPLERLSAAGGGKVVSSTSAADLTAQFKAAAQRLSNQLLVTATVPAKGPSGQVTLAVTGLAGGTEVSDSALAVIASASPRPTKPVNSAPLPVNVGSGPLMDQQLIWVAVALFFLGLLGVLTFALNAATPAGGTSVKKQLSVYTLTGGKAKKRARESTAFGESAIAQTAVEFAGRIAAKRGFEGWLQERLEAGGNPLKPAEWILLQSVIILLLPLFAFVISGRSLVWTVIGAVVAILRGFVMLGVRANRRRKKFEDSLADTLQLMAGSLSAGYSLPQAADSVVREGQDPISTEFNKALVETRLGVPIDDALESIADRMRSKDWAWVVMAIRIQREVGGNLAELLLTVASTLRERARLRRQVQTLSAEGRLSAWILGGLPIVFALYLLTARPSYILALTKEPLGWLMIVGAVILTIVGGLWMKKIVNVEV